MRSQSEKRVPGWVRLLAGYFSSLTGLALLYLALLERLGPQAAATAAVGTAIDYLIGAEGPLAVMLGLVALAAVIAFPILLLITAAALLLSLLLR